MKMKLPALLKASDTATKLREAETAHAAAEGKLSSLQDDRTAALGNDDIDAARRLDRLIAEQRQTVTTLADRTGLLRTKVALEQRERRIRDYQAAIAHIEADLLPPRAAAAAELEAALKAVAIAARNFRDASNGVIAKWPINVPRPFEYRLSMVRVGERTKACFQPGLLVRKYTLRDAERHEFVDKILEADGRADGFAAGEVEQHAKLLSELRERGVPEPQSEPDEEAA